MWERGGAIDLKNNQQEDQDKADRELRGGCLESHLQWICVLSEADDFGAPFMPGIIPVKSKELH